MVKNKTIIGIKNFMENLGGVEISRKTALTTNTKNGIVDTVCPPDTNKWETGIKKIKTNNWVIVKQYEDELKAKQGHKQWCKKMENNIKLKDINLWGL